MSEMKRGILAKLPEVSEQTVNRLFALYTAAVVFVLLLPLAYLLPISMHPDGLTQIPTSPTLKWYSQLFANGSLLSALGVSVQLGLLTAVVTTPLAFLAAAGTRNVARRDLVIGFFLLPIFMPGVSVGLGLAVYFELIGVSLSIWTMLIGHILWTFPFAYIIILTSMASFDPHLKEAAYDLGANEWRAFRDVELPRIQPGLIGAAIFSFTLSFNEFSRTMLVRGPTDTLPTYVLSRVQNLGVDPTVYAISGLTVVVSSILLVVIGYFTLKTTES
ncbi:ABC transporter permease [Natronomonas gomsonensis]|uniref:ABC transporter permease n=1 Tax=Natronomonas gomsonensis TaxID=1046043 RepID=UPI0015BFB5A5|nr:ABC transporter permease [Natronomonas gomsonensis]